MTRQNFIEKWWNQRVQRASSAPFHTPRFSMRRRQIHKKCGLSETPLLENTWASNGFTSVGMIHTSKGSVRDIFCKNASNNTLPLRLPRGHMFPIKRVPCVATRDFQKKMSLGRPPGERFFTKRCPFLHQTKESQLNVASVSPKEREIYNRTWLLCHPSGERLAQKWEPNDTHNAPGSRHAHTPYHCTP